MQNVSRRTGSPSLFVRGSRLPFWTGSNIKWQQKACHLSFGLTLLNCLLTPVNAIVWGSKWRVPWFSGLFYLTMNRIYDPYISSIPKYLNICSKNMQPTRILPRLMYSGKSSLQTVTYQLQRSHKFVSFKVKVTQSVTYHIQSMSEHPH
jgi:hypothetical protein